jgi:hypothetical protein
MSAVWYIGSVSCGYVGNCWKLGHGDSNAQKVPKLISSLSGKVGIYDVSILCVSPFVCIRSFNLWRVATSTVLW